MNYGTQSQGTEYIPDIKEILMILWRNRNTIILVGVVTVLAGLLLILAKPKVYNASATVLIQDHNLALQDFSDVTAGGKFDDMTVQTEVKLLSSANLALQTIKSTGLDKTEEFKADKAEDLVSGFMKNLSVAPQGTSRMIEISFKAKDPELAAKVVNEHVKNYMQYQVAIKQQRVEQLSQWFQGKVKDLKLDVIRKSQAVEAYRANENLVFGKGDEELIFGQISAISDELAPLQVHKYEIQAKLESIEAAKKNGSANTLVDVVNSPLIQNLKERASVAAQTNANTQYGPNHPKRLASKGEAGQINSAISREVANIVQSLKNDEAATTSQEAKLKEKLGELQLQADGQREKMIMLKALTVEQEASQKVLDAFLANYENIQSQVSFAKADAVMISSASAPLKPSGIGRSLLMLVVIVFAGCLALTIVFVKEVMRSGIRSFEDLRKMGQSKLFILPKVEDPALAMQGMRNSSYREAIKRIYMSSLLNGNIKSLLITSALPGEGRTNFVASLAYYLLSLNHKVIVVDADFLRPSLSLLSGQPAGQGLTDVMAGRAALASVITKNQYGLDVLRAGTEAMSSPDALRSDKFKSLLAQLKESYAFVLIDSGPLLSHAEADIIAGEVEGVIAVVEWMKTSRQNAERMFAMLERFSTPLLGVVINKLDIDKYKKSTSGDDFLLPNIGQG